MGALPLRGTARVLRALIFIAMAAVFLLIAQAIQYGPF